MVFDSSPELLPRAARDGSGRLVETAPSQHALAGLAALAVRDIDKSADAAQQTVLVLVEHSIRIRNFPEHLYELDPLLKREPLVDDPGEMEQLGRFGSRCLAGGEQLIRIGPRQAEAALQQPRNDVAFRFIKS